MNNDGATASTGEHILYSPLPRYAFRPPVMVLLFLPCMFAAAVLGLYWGGTPLKWILTVAGFAAFLGIVLLFSFFMPHYYRFSHIRPSEIERRGFGAALLDIQRRKLFYRRRDDGVWSWAQIIRCADGPLPRTVAEVRMQKRLTAIGLVDDMLEPEAILSSLGMKRGLLVFFIATYILAIVTTRDTTTRLLVAGLSCFLLLRVPSIRDKFRIGDGKLVAGLGVIETSRGKRWTANDAMMIVQTQDGDPPLTVCFTGEAGELVLHFIDEKDPDFIKLWQRWNHPHPRPELLIT